MSAARAPARTSRRALSFPGPRRSGRALSHVVGFDDAPFERDHRGDVRVVGAVFAGTRLDGVLSTRVRRDGANAARQLAACLEGSRFRPQLHAILLQGIAFAGFNVVDLPALHRSTGLPVIVVARRRPDLQAIRTALLGRVRGGARKWRLIEAAGPMEPVAGVYVQRLGVGVAEVEALLARLQLHGRLPEPLRVAHLIAGGVITGESRHRA
jgi:hypothetical protein